MIETIIKKFVGVVILGAASLYPQSTPSPAPDSWGPLQFLVGTWGGTTQGGSAGAAGSGSYSFQPELRNHILARHSSSTGCKGPADFDCDHADLLYVYRDVSGQPYKAIYFDNE